MRGLRRDAGQWRLWRQDQRFDRKRDHEHHQKARQETARTRRRAHMRFALHLLLDDRLSQLERRQCDGDERKALQDLIDAHGDFGTGGNARPELHAGKSDQSDAARDEKQADQEVSDRKERVDDTHRAAVPASHELSVGGEARGEGKERAAMTGRPRVRPGPAASGLSDAAANQVLELHRDVPGRAGCARGLNEYIETRISADARRRRDSRKRPRRGRRQSRADARPGARAADQERKTTPSVCPYCSVGCATLVHTIEGRIVNIEGDPRSPHNEGTLCPKGAAIFQLHVNPNRPTQVLHRAAGATDWEIWDLGRAMDRVAQLVRKTRDETFIEKLGSGTTANCTTAIFSLGGATLDNEWNHIQQKLLRGLGIVPIENQARI